MAVIWAVVGGGAVVGIATSNPYSDYSDYSNYSNYGDYSNYSDAAERKRRRMEAKLSEVNQERNTVNSYKTEKVNSHLKDKQLIQSLGENVSVREVEKDGNITIDSEQKQAELVASEDIRKELDDIDALLSSIDEILEDNN